jgi:hypothetical protein
MYADFIDHQSDHIDILHQYWHQLIIVAVSIEEVFVSERANLLQLSLKLRRGS